MPEFGFTEEQEMFRTSVRRFAQKELAKGADERAKTHGLSQEMVKRMAELGFLGIPVPEEYGGQGGDWVSQGIAIEEFSKVDPGTGNAVMLGPLGFLCLEQAKEGVKER